MSGPRPSLAARFQFTIGRVLFGLPMPVKQALAGRPIRRGGETLDADMHLMLRLLALQGHRHVDQGTVAEARAAMRRTAEVVAGPPAPVARVDAVEIPGPAGPLAGRLYVPAATPVGLLVYYHGGGWVVGDLDTHDPVARLLARDGDLAVLTVDYRLAPEHRFPAAVGDALAAFRWAAAGPAALGLDALPVAVGGDSAGGNLAAVVAQLAARGGGPPPAAQLLIYPATDLSTKHPSYALFREGFFLTEGEVDWYRAHYLGPESDPRDPRVSPLLASDLRGLAPAVVLTAGFDVLRDEGEAYARRLADAGVPVRATRHGGLLHGFANVATLSATARAAMHDAAADLRAILARA